MTTQNRGRNRPNGQCGRSQRQALKPIRTTLIRLNVEDPAWGITMHTAFRMCPNKKALMQSPQPSHWFTHDRFVRHQLHFSSPAHKRPHGPRPLGSLRSPSLVPTHNLHDPSRCTLTRSSTWTFVVQLSLSHLVSLCRCSEATLVFSPKYCKSAPADCNSKSSGVNIPLTTSKLHRYHLLVDSLLC